MNLSSKTKKRGLGSQKQQHNSKTAETAAGLIMSPIQKKSSHVIVPQMTTNEVYVNDNSNQVSYSSSKTESNFLMYENVSASSMELERRKSRFAAKQTNSSKTPVISTQLGEPIVGICMNVEKSYFRLTSFPNPADIRPEPVLKQAFKRLKSLWKSDHDLVYLLDQMKAIRQDLVVQRLQTVFTVKVYESNARMALDHADLNEFNQCQSMLSSLYNDIHSKHELEFLAYSLLYDVILNKTIDLHRHLGHAYHGLTHRFIRHALLVISAVRSDDYPYFMRLLSAAPSGSRQLMQMHVTVMRRRMLKLSLNASLPSLSIKSLASLLEINEDTVSSLLTEYDIVGESSVEIAANRAAIVRIPY